MINPKAWLKRKMGDLLLRRGNRSLALWCYGDFIAASPADPVAAYEVGKAVLALGDLKLATRAFQLSVALRPDYPEALNNLGVCHARGGRAEDAITCYERAIELKPDFDVAHNNLGNIALAESRLEAAEECYNRALQSNPRNVEALNNLSVVHWSRSHFEQAERCARAALDIQPGFAGAYVNLGSALRYQDCQEAAISAYEQALALDPMLVEASVSLAEIRFDAASSHQVVEFYEEQVKSNPASFQAHSKLALAIQRMDYWDEAEVHFKEALRIKPDYSESVAGLGNNYAFQGLVDEALTQYRQALEIYPFWVTHQNIAFYLHHQYGIGPEVIFKEHQNWARTYEEPLAAFIRPLHNRPDPDRKLKIGYVSADFRRHSVAYFLEPVFQCHDRSQFEIICYSNVPRSDAMTRTFRELADGWHDATLWSHEHLAEQIRKDEIDILVDLSGYTSGNRLRTFAMKPAPIQVTYLGYPDTTGMSAMGYRITDAIADPPGATERFHTEELIRIDGGFLAFKPAATAPDVAPPPCLRKGAITFGSFNNATKLNARVIEVWADILKAVPGSRLMLKSYNFSSLSARRRIRDIFLSRDIPESRIDFCDFIAETRSHLDLYGEIDIALDPFPYNGTTTTCDALWMGVPVVTLCGSTHVSRVGAMLLTLVGHPELVAQEVDDYVKKTVDLANDMATLASLRGGMREAMRQSPVMDSARLTGALEQSFRQMWRTWCAQQDKP
jgi:protein O-GlcNAc transferase